MSRFFTPHRVILIGAFVVAMIYVTSNKDDLNQWVETVEQEQEYQVPTKEDFNQVLSRLEQVSEEAEGMNQQTNLALSFYQEAQSLAEQGSHEEAITWYEKALDLFPDERQFHQGIAISLRAVGKHEEAKIHEEAALKQN